MAEDLVFVLFYFYGRNVEIGFNFKINLILTTRQILDCLGSFFTKVTLKLKFKMKL